MTASVIAWSPAIHSLPSKTINAKIHQLPTFCFYLNKFHSRLQLRFYITIYPNSIQINCILDSERKSLNTEAVCLHGSEPVLKGALAFVCFSFFFFTHFLLCVLDKAEYSAFESTLNSSILSYRIVCIYIPVSTVAGVTSAAVPVVGLCCLPRPTALSYACRMFSSASRANSSCTWQHSITVTVIITRAKDLTSIPTLCTPLISVLLLLFVCVRFWALKTKDRKHRCWNG